MALQIRTPLQFVIGQRTLIYIHDLHHGESGKDLEKFDQPMLTFTPSGSSAAVDFVVSAQENIRGYDKDKPNDEHKGKIHGYLYTTTPTLHHLIQKSLFERIWDQIKEFFRIFSGRRVHAPIGSGDLGGSTTSSSGGGTIAFDTLKSIQIYQ